MKGALAATLAVAMGASTSAAFAAPPLSLGDAQREARAHAPDVAQLTARVRGAEGTARDATRALRSDPSLRIGYETGALAGEAGEYSITAELAWTLDVSGSWKPRARAAAAERDRTQFDRDDGLRALDEAVAIAVAELASADRLAARSARIDALYGLAADAAHRQLDAGQGDQLQVDGADLDLASARADLAKAHGDADAARIRLARILGRERALDLRVEDPLEMHDSPLHEEVARTAEGDPRVRAAEADLRAATNEIEMNERLVWPTPTFGLGYAYRHREVPASAFSGAALPSGLSAVWFDHEVGASITLPLPLFDRNRLPRVQSAGRAAVAEASFRVVRASVHAELEQAWTELNAAREAYAAVAPSPAIIHREFDLLERAVRAGAMDSVAQAQAIRRLIDAGKRFDAAVLDLRVGRARWARRTTAK